MDGSDLRRRRDAKASNERLKLVATLFNNGTVAVITYALFAPLINHKDPVRLDWLLLAAALQMSAHGLLFLFKSED